jgi:3',5'-cyclic-AMP phosphodiesterase
MAMRLAWTSDLHLVFLSRDGDAGDDSLTSWLDTLARQTFDALAISGDISEAPSLHDHLSLLERSLQRPIYFVLGNHDFYRGSFQTVIPAVRDFTSDSCRLHCLDLMDFVELTPATALLGHGCWGDGGYGDFFRSQVLLNDWKVIDELRQWRRGPWRLSCLTRCGACEREIIRWPVTCEDLDRPAMLEQLAALGARAADHIRRVLPRALEAKQNVILLTHTPPFAPRCVPTPVDWDGWAPHAGCKAAGDAISEIMNDYPDRRLLILSGHVHCSSDIQISRNIEQRTAGAAYGQPRVEEIIEVPSE